MSTINSTLSLPFFRDIEVCPYRKNCRYANDCVYEGEKEQAASPAWRFQDVAVSVGQWMLGAALLVVGVALTLTLFLIPLGLPLALLGVALLGTSGEAIGRSA